MNKKTAVTIEWIVLMCIISVSFFFAYPLFVVLAMLVSVGAVLCAVGCVVIYLNSKLGGE